MPLQESKRRSSNAEPAVHRPKDVVGDETLARIGTDVVQKDLPEESAGARDTEVQAGLVEDRPVDPAHRAQGNGIGVLGVNIVHRYGADRYGAVDEKFSVIDHDIEYALVNGAESASVRPHTATVRDTPCFTLDGMTARQPFPLLADRPVVLEGIILDFHWDLERLHGLSLPVREVPASALRWHLGLPFWAAEGRPFRVSPAEVAAEPSAHPEQWRRTMVADLRYPLEAYAGPEDGLTILDGVHRLLKAVIEGHSTLQVRVLEVDAFDAIAVPPQR